MINTTQSKMEQSEAVHKLSDLRYKLQCMAEAAQSAATLIYADQNQKALEDLDHATDLWNEVINEAPRTLKAVKLNYLL